MKKIIFILSVTVCYFVSAQSNTGLRFLNGSGLPSQKTIVTYDDTASYFRWGMSNGIHTLYIPYNLSPTIDTGGISSLNGLVTSTQVFAVDTTYSTSPVFVSSGSTHTLRIPMARINDLVSGYPSADSSIYVTKGTSQVITAPKYFTARQYMTSLAVDTIAKHRVMDSLIVIGQDNTNSFFVQGVSGGSVAVGTQGTASGSSSAIALTGSGSGYEYSGIGFYDSVSGKSWGLSYRDGKTTASEKRRLLLYYYNGSTYSTFAYWDSIGNYTIPSGYIDSDSIRDDATTRATSGTWHSGIGAWSLGAITSASLTSQGAISGTTGTFSGDIAVNGDDITMDGTTQNIFNVTGTTINAFGAGTTINIGATTGKTTFSGAVAVEDSLRIGTSTPLTISSAGALTTTGSGSFGALSGTTGTFSSNLTIASGGALGDSNYISFTGNRASFGYEGANGAYIWAGSGKRIRFLTNGGASVPLILASDGSATFGSSISAGAISGTTGTFSGALQGTTLKLVSSAGGLIDMNSVNASKSNPAYQMFIKATDSLNATVWYLGDGSSTDSLITLYANSGYGLRIFSNNAQHAYFSNSANSVFFGTSFTTGNANLYAGTYYSGTTKVLDPDEVLTSATTVSIGATNALSTFTGAVAVDDSLRIDELGVPITKAVIDSNALEFTANSVEYRAMQNAYGELYISADPDTITIGTADVYYTTKDLDAGVSKYVTLGDSSMTVKISGYYHVTVSSSMTHSTNNTIVHFSFFKNDVEEVKMEAERKIGTGGDFGNASASGIIYLAANDIAKIKYKADNTGTAIINHFNFTIHRID